MLLGTNWAPCPCGPSPWPFLKKDSPKYSSQMWNEWEFSCIARMKQPFPLKYTHGSKLGASKILYPLCSNSTSWKLLQLFFFYNVSPCPGKARRCALRAEDVFFREPFETKLKRRKKKEKRGLLFHLLPWRISPHVKLRSKSESFACVPWCFQQKESCPVLASKPWIHQHLLDWSAADTLTGWRQIAV